VSEYWGSGEASETCGVPPRAVLQCCHNHTQQAQTCVDGIAGTCPWQGTSTPKAFR